MYIIEKRIAFGTNFKCFRKSLVRKSEVRYKKRNESANVLISLIKKGTIKRIMKAYPQIFGYFSSSVFLPGVDSIFILYCRCLAARRTRAPRHPLFAPVKYPPGLIVIIAKNYTMLSSMRSKNERFGV